MEEIKKEEQIQGLMLLVFEKAKKESKKTNAYGLAKHLKSKVNIDRRTLTRYYNGYILNRKNERRLPYDYNLDSLSKYLSFKDFISFTLKLEDQEDKISLIKEKNELESKIERIKKIALASCLILLVIATIFILKYYKKNCMIWTGNKYEKVRCSGLDTEKPLDEIILKEFRKVTVCEDSIFFKNGEPIKHYLKHNGQIDFFTHTGEHPIYNGKFLNEVTQTIIDNHVKPCDSIKLLKQ